MPKVKKDERNQMQTILSIQSHVAFGHVGNAAAVFPLQRVGFNVIPINTVQFSNHTGYGDWTGQVFDAPHIIDLFNGLAKRGAFDKIDAVLTGYLGAPALGDAILDMIKTRLPPHALWLCDPVMGDVDRGMFVKDGIPDFFKSRALPRANIITPNQYELEYLSGVSVETLDDARRACKILHDMGPETILVTSLIHSKTSDEDIQMMASHKNGAQYIVTTPRLPLPIAPNGAGDFTSAMFLARHLMGDDLKTALSNTAGAVFALFEETMKAGTRELALISAQDKYVGATGFQAKPL